MRDNRILLICIGVLFYLTALTYAFIFQEILRVLILNLENVPHLLVKILTEILYVLVIVVAVMLFFKTLKTDFLSSKKLFFGLLILYIGGQLFQFLSTSFLYRFNSDMFWDNSSEFYHFIRNDWMLSSLGTVRSIIVDFIIIILLYQNRHLVLNLDSAENEIQDIGK